MRRSTKELLATIVTNQVNFANTVKAINISINNLAKDVEALEKKITKPSKKKADKRKPAPKKKVEKKTSKPVAKKKK